MTDLMRAVVISSPGPPEVLQQRMVPVPAPAPGEVLIEVMAFGLNRSELHFGLENGAEQLGPWFAHVERRDYPDSLLVTEAEPLIAYATSSVLWGTQGDEIATEKLSARIRQQLAEDGAIRISKNSGLFVAQR